TPHPEGVKRPRDLLRTLLQVKWIPRFARDEVAHLQPALVPHVPSFRSIRNIRVVIPLHRRKREADLSPILTRRSSTYREGRTRGRIEGHAVADDVAQALAFEKQLPAPLVDDLREHFL